jgi:hypothetical protein
MSEHTVHMHVQHCDANKPWETFERTLKGVMQGFSKHLMKMTSAKIRIVRDEADKTGKEATDPITKLCADIAWSCCQIELRERGQSGEQEEVFTA